jgi:UDP:flavonoid glycosyltransferase YjiC (YdhE family)
VDILFTTYLDAVSYIRKEGFPLVEVPAMDFKVEPDGTVDFRRTAMNPGPFVASFHFLEQVNKEIEVMERFKPDVVVSDSRASPVVAATILGIPSLCILNQFQVIIPRRTHYLRLAKFADAMSLAILGKIWTTGVKVMIPDFPPPFTISSDNLRIPKAYKKKVELIGPILPVHPDELPTKRALGKKLGLNDEKPIIFAPISGPSKERAYLLNILRTIFADFPNFQVVLSLGYPASDGAPVERGDLTIFNWAPNRFEYLKACDLVVSRAGHGTILQAICYGKPVILIPTPNHTEQRNNARKTAGLGVGRIIAQEDLDRDTLLWNVNEMMKDETLAENAETLRKEASKLRGLETAVKTTIEIAEKGVDHVRS